MPEPRFLVLTVAEVRDQLAIYYRDWLIEHPAMTADMIREGKLNDAVPHFPSITNQHLAARYRELDLGKRYFPAPKALTVYFGVPDFVVMRDGESFIILAERDTP